MTLNLEPIKERLTAWRHQQEASILPSFANTIEYVEALADFNAHTTEDMAALIAEVERLRKRIKRYQGKLVVPVAQMHAWDEGYNAGKRDYAASIGAGASIVTDNPYLGPALGCRHD